MEYLLFLFIWVTGFSMSLYYCDMLLNLKGKKKIWYLVFALFSWVAVFLIFIYLTCWSALCSIKDSFKN